MVLKGDIHCALLLVKCCWSMLRNTEVSAFSCYTHGILFMLIWRNHLVIAANKIFYGFSSTGVHVQNSQMCLCPWSQHCKGCCNACAYFFSLDHICPQRESLGFNCLWYTRDPHLLCLLSSGPPCSIEMEGLSRPDYGHSRAPTACQRGRNC